MSNPSYTLDVDGDINLSTGSTLKINGTDAVFSNWTVSGSDIYRSSGNVGIGRRVLGTSWTCLAQVDLLELSQRLHFLGTRRRPQLLKRREP